MKKKILTLITASTVVLTTLNGCGGGSNSSASSDSTNQESSTQSTSEPASEPLNLTGTWASEETDGSYQEAVISDSTITINWISDGGATASLYWAGSYTAPTSDIEEYSWTSERDAAQTDSALLASTDDTKEFSYKDGKISYSVSALGITTTYELTRTSDEVPDPTPESTQTSEPMYDITYEDITFYTDELGDIYGKSIVEVTNTGETDLYLDYSSYELISDTTGAIIHTTSDAFTPYPNVIAPGEKGYYYEYAPMDAGTPTEGISITSHIRAAVATVENIRYDVSNTAMYNKENGDFDVHGMITKSTDEDEYVNIAAVLFDSEQHPLGVLSNVLSPINSGDSVGFELESYSVPDNITTSMISDYKVYAYPDQYQYID